MGLQSLPDPQETCLTLFAINQADLVMMEQIPQRESRPMSNVSSASNQQPGQPGGGGGGRRGGEEGRKEKRRGGESRKEGRRGKEKRGGESLQSSDVLVSPPSLSCLNVTTSKTSKRQILGSRPPLYWDS